MFIIFSHGKESGPWGSKIKALAKIAEKYGFDVESIDYSDITDPDQRIARLLKNVRDKGEDVVLVGSSMGGYVSLVASEQLAIKAMFLLAPALYMDGYKAQNYHASCKQLDIVHGWSDDVILPENSIKFAKSSDCTLHLISGDHRLNDSMAIVTKLFETFLTAVIKE